MVGKLSTLCQRLTAGIAHFYADQLRQLLLLLLPRQHRFKQPLKQRPQQFLQLLLQLLGIQIHPSASSCATGTDPSGQNMLLVVVSNLPINQLLKTT